MHSYSSRIPLVTGLAGIVAASTVMAGVLSASAASPGAAASWRAARELPGIGSLNKGGDSKLLALSCGSAGNCAAGGFYYATKSHGVAFVADQRKGTWHAAVQVPGIGALYKGGLAQVVAMSCSSAGNCAAGGSYDPTPTTSQAFVVAEKNGRWAKGIVAPGTKTLNKGDGATVQSVSCAKGGSCAAVGTYRDGSFHRQAFLLNSVNGTWRAAKLVHGLAQLNLGNDAELLSVSCPAPGDCSAGGFYTDASPYSQGFVVTERNGSWGSASEVPGLGTLNTGGYAQVTVISCASAGNCTAGGYYHTGSSQVQAFIATESNNKWFPAVQVPGTGTLNAGQDAFVTSVSCASAANCTAAGSYADNLGHSWPFVLTKKNGKWTNARQAPGVAKLSGKGMSGEIVSVSCASAGNCVGAGDYNNYLHSVAFLIVQRNGTWSAATNVPGLGSLNKGNSYATAVSCRAGSCTAGGYYTDIRARLEAFVISGG